jgi:hypothetical protein
MATTQTEILDDMVQHLRTAGGDSLLSVILYGAEARGDHYESVQDLYLLIVLKDLELETLAPLRNPIKRWLKKGNPMPRFFSPSLIADASDVFSIEFLDIAGHHRLLHGDDPFTDMDVSTQHLRLQCERELREKLMRLQEAYVEVRGRDADLKRLLAGSYLAFVDIFRGCLRLHAKEVPAHADDIVTAFCNIAELDPAPFRAAEQLAHGTRPDHPIDEVFASYYTQLTNAVHAVDNFGDQDS